MEMQLLYERKIKSMFEGVKSCRTCIHRVEKPEKAKKEPKTMVLHDKNGEEYTRVFPTSEYDNYSCEENVLVFDEIKGPENTHELKFGINNCKDYERIDG